MASPLAELRRFLTASLLNPVAPPEDDVAPPSIRRRLVVAVTAVVGALVMAWALDIQPGDTLFYTATALLAAVWAVGALASGPLPRGRSRTRNGRRDGAAVVQSLALAALLLGLFALGGVGVAHIPVLRDSVQELLDHARFGTLPVVIALTAVNGIAEEMFFRGALYAAFERWHPVAVTTIAYALVTVPTGIPLLTLAAVVLGLVTALQRRVTQGIAGPMVTHVTWSVGMLLLLPPVLAIGV